MTIAIGFVYDSGVLLCADSQFTVGAMKMEGMKLGNFKAAWGSVTSTFAGNVDFATAAFHSAHRAVSDIAAKDDPVPAFERRLAGFYKKHVYGHPQYETGDYDYQMLLAIRTYAAGQSVLYQASDTIIRPVGAFSCIGVGEELAHYLMRFLWTPDMNEREAVCLASYALATVKYSVEQCGGASRIHCLRNTGVLQDYSQDVSTAHIEQVAGWFVSQAQKFLIYHTTDNEEDFARYLLDLNAAGEHLKKLWEARKSGIPNPTGPILGR